ncbi:sensor histidine kinase [Sporosarcina sp. ACRSL]|uniref:sensor histidine kinase n=1 Tax=Sporosarcina sp. ACRSL TaxID=2918215 RepID=UPI001EF6C4E7|nr:sensor histidine kinase [Sporosarcina sp. ACRSL]MCG7344972.1 sensor histidine kinase [Sporosarcina sp. ACRSL]
MLTKHMTQKGQKIDIMALLLTAVLTAVAGEFKYIPFYGEAFRFSLGSIIFFLLLLIRPSGSLPLTGFVTGLAVVMFRTGVDVTAISVSLLESFQHHLPIFFYYVVFALGFHFIGLDKYRTAPLLLGLWATFFEFVGNITENVMRIWTLNSDGLMLRDLALLGGVATLRSFFVVGLYSSIILSEQKKRVQEMLGIGSNLYAESLYLQKSMNHVEQVTAASYELYRKLKQNNLHDLSVQALAIAQEIHEVKKDSQRILSGLSNITKEDSSDRFLLSDLFDYVITSNRKYSELLKRSVDFRLTITVDFETDQHIPLLALLNNITANAVESIDRTGSIAIHVSEEADDLLISIQDTGKGIRKEDIPILFEPGYTTKYNEQGVAATGIGLSHVQQIIQTLQGDVQFQIPEKGTIFQIRIPSDMIRK